MATFKDPTIITAIIAAAIALISLILNLIVSIRTNKLANFLEVTNASLEFKKQQLNELYRPLIALNKQSERLAGKLKHIKNSNFQLFNELPDILNEPDVQPIIDQLLENNDKIEALLLTKSSLIHSFAYPKSFHLCK